MKWLAQARGLMGPGTTWVAFVGAVGILVIAAAIALDVLMRWLFNAPILGVDDLSKFILAVVISSFFPVGLAKGHFVTIRFLGKALGPRSTLWLEVLGAVGTLAVFVFFTWRLFLYAAETTRTGLATVVLEFPVAPWWWFVTIVMVVCVVVQLVVLADRIIAAVSGRPPADESGGAPAPTGG